MALVGLGVAAWGALGVGARAEPSARVTADEPQYLLTAISLGEDRSLDISDELAQDRWREFHRAQLPVQTAPDSQGREVSPHDPLLPLLLAAPVALGGATGAKLFLSLLAGVLAALLVWTAVRRFAVAVVPAAVVVAAFGLSPPLAAYASQVYPELPAALAVAVAVAAITAPTLTRSERGAGRMWPPPISERPPKGRAPVTVALAAIVALPWLSVKYVPVAAALTLCLLWRLVPRPGPADPEPGPTVSAPPRLRWSSAIVALLLAAAGVAYLGLHQLWYGGWTVYAAGDHFVGGELTVVGVEPDYLGRSQRLLGLIVDRDFGLAAWGPVILVAVGALAALARRRPPGSLVIALPLAAGWLNATFVALTMHGFWWPGRQVVVVMPAIVLATAWWASTLPRRALVVIGALGLAGMALWATMLAQVRFGDWTLISDVDRWANPAVGAWRRTLPDLRDDSVSTWVLLCAWLVVLARVATWAWRSAGNRVVRSGAAPVLSPLRRGVEQSGSSSGS